MEDEEDTIVEEIPVFLCKKLQDNLHLFQYPTKPNTTSFESATVVNCCVKPINQDVKVDFALNTDSKFYDQFKGEQFALAADGKTQAKGERPTYRHGIMDKQSYVSTKSLDNVDKYVVGTFEHGAIHLSPLTSILQLRPNFSYFDKEDKRTKAEEKAANDEEDDEELQQVTVKFSRTGEKLKKAKEKTYDYMVKKSAEEPWCETFWHSRLSPTAELEREKMICRNQEPPIVKDVDKTEYTTKLITSGKVEHSIDTILPSKVISKKRLKNMNLNEQLKVILKDAKMLTFDDIMTFMEQIDESVTTEKVLRTLPLVGVLIRGNWVPQSELLYPAETLSNSNGVSSELMIRGRDYVLYKFSKEESLYRRKVIIATQLPPDEVLEILQSVARLNSEKKWELLRTPDKTFETRYPDLVQRQELMWRATEQTFNELDYEKSPKRTRKRSVRDAK